MADSNDVKQDDFLDDFDAMLQDSSIAGAGEEILDADDSTIAEDEIDEFAEIDELPDSIAPLNQETENEAQIETDVEDEVDEFAVEVDEKSADTAAGAIAEDDEFLNADFDISTEDDEVEQADDVIVETAETELVEELVEDADDEILVAEAPPQPEAATAVAEEKIIDEVLHARVDQLWAEMEGIKESVQQTQSDQEDAVKKQKKNTQELGKGTAKVSQLSYVALGIAVLSLILVAVLMFYSFSQQSQLEEVNAIVIDLEETVSDSLVNKDPSTHVLTLQQRVQFMDNKLAIIDRQLTDLINSQAIQQQQSSLVDADEQERIQSITQQYETLHQQLGKLQSKVDKLEKKAPKSDSKKAKKTSEWTVNLISFKLEWYAKKKAAEFKQKGIPVEVVKAIIKGETWYRIRVSGFKSKYEAGAYAGRVKKTLNLSSVWVTQK